MSRIRKVISDKLSEQIADEQKCPFYKPDEAASHRGSEKE